MQLDPFDPNTWQSCEHEHRIYLTSDLELYAIVDAEDYSHFSRWCWIASKSSPRTHGKKRYATRSQAYRSTHKPRLYLHIEIMKRTGIEKPTPDHRLVNHKNGNSLDCRRDNLEWATTKSNHVGVTTSRNRGGRFVKRSVTDVWT